MKPGSGIWFGLTPAQRETLVAAVDGSYYPIPRRLSTEDLADRFDISDQAVTERLRRAIVALTENALAEVENGADSLYGHLE
jgi:predicted DNA binding protein